MRPPCEIIVHKVLAGIRAELAMRLLDEGLSQQEIASKLGLSKAAVSQYVNAKRGFDIDISGSVEEEMQKLTEILKNETQPTEVVDGICAICHAIQDSGWLCKEHIGPSHTDENCAICMKHKH